jgi:predicted transcriptional regulator
MPSLFERILSGIKKYEYRRKFLKEAVNAFIYVSTPVKEIRGFIEFGEPLYDKVDKIAEIADQETLGGGGGIVEYLEGLDMGYAIPVISCRTIQSLSLEELRNNFNFTAPQSYIYVESIPKLQEILNQRLVEELE